jgi:hypothetical protein
MVPKQYWDEVISATYMSASYELLRIASEKREFKVVQTCLKLGPASASSQSHFNQYILHPFDAITSKEAQALSDTLHLSQEWSKEILSISNGIHNNMVLDKGATKKTTPREEKSTNIDARIEDVLPYLSIPSRGFSELKTHFVNHKDFVPYACRVVKLGIDTGDYKSAECWLNDIFWSTKLNLSPDAKAILAQLNAGHLYTEQTKASVPVPLTEIQDEIGRPSDVGNKMQILCDESSLAEPDVSDYQVFLWSGEYFYLKALTQVSV